MIKTRNIGIFAHVDAGKTTLSEQLLSHAGAIRTVGSVDSGTAHTDTLPVERRRGISVKATCVSFNYKDVQINLIDTPGHADFSAEIERSMWALDGAVLVVCAVEGVQPQTEILFETMQQQNIPVIFFINKTDRAGADIAAVVAQIQHMLSKKAVLTSDQEGICELLCDSDDGFMEKYLDGQNISDSCIAQRFAALAHSTQAYPILCGSALRDDGVLPLLDALAAYIPAPVAQSDLCGVIFAAQQDKVLGRGVWVRLYGGNLTNRDPIDLPAGIDPSTGEMRQVQSKVAQIFGTDSKPSGQLSAGQIGLVFGLGNIPIGHIIGSKELLPRKIEPGKLRTPLITVQAIPENPEDMQALRTACDILSGEDPLLQTQYIPTHNALHLKAMGTIQLEILEEVLSNRFDLKVHFSPPAIIFKETISQAAEGFASYTMPKPCWAKLRFLIEPAPRGSGVSYSSMVPVKDIAARYQHQVEQALPIALNQGRMGWQVTDVKITLIGGEHHLEHTHPLDFIVTTPMAIQDGLRNGGSTLLEPILAVKFRLPGESVGRVMSDINLMRGEVLESISDGDRMILYALIPVQSSLDYAVTLATVTGGRGSMSGRLHGYRECPTELGASTPRRNVDPLDKAKYILAARSALEGGIYNID